MDHISCYDIDRLTQDIQAILRIQDWTIDVDLCTYTEMLEEGGEATDLGLCFRLRERKYARILINEDGKDPCGSNWFTTLLHELMHVATDDLMFTVDQTTKFLNEDIQEKMEESINIFYERTVDQLAESIAQLLGEDCVEQYRSDQNETSKDTE